MKERGGGYVGVSCCVWQRDSTLFFCLTTEEERKNHSESRETLCIERLIFVFP